MIQGELEEVGDGYHRADHVDERLENGATLVRVASGRVDENGAGPHYALQLTLPVNAFQLTAERRVTLARIIEGLQEIEFAPQMLVFGMGYEVVVCRMGLGELGDVYGVEKEYYMLDNLDRQMVDVGHRS